MALGLFPQSRQFTTPDGGHRPQLNNIDKFAHSRKRVSTRLVAQFDMMTLGSSRNDQKLTLPTRVYHREIWPLVDVT